MAKGPILKIRLEKGGGGPVFCESAPIDCTRSIASFIERVLDSSRYFVLKVIDPASKRATHLGIGFREKSDAFDFNAVIHDHVTSSTRQAKDDVDSKSASNKEESEEDEHQSNFSSLTSPVKIEFKGALLKPKAESEGKEDGSQGLASLSPPPLDPPRKPTTSATPTTATPATPATATPATATPSILLAPPPLDTPTTATPTTAAAATFHLITNANTDIIRAPTVEEDEWGEFTSS